MLLQEETSGAIFFVDKKALLALTVRRPAFKNMVQVCNIAKISACSNALHCWRDLHTKWQTTTLEVGKLSLFSALSIFQMCSSSRSVQGETRNKAMKQVPRQYH